MGLHALSAIGRDRPGIVAAITEVLLELKGNVEDSRMSILRGHFAVMLLVELPSDVSLDAVRGRLEKVRGRLELEAIAVSPVDEVDPGPRPTHVLSVYGADHPGIVHSVSTVLAGRGVSITDLETRLSGPPERPAYVMLMEIAAGAVEVEPLRAELEQIGEREGLEVSLRELTADAL